MLTELGSGGPWRPGTGEGSSRANRRGTGTSSNAETNAATEQRVRGHHEGSDELGSDSRRVTSATGDRQVATAKEEAQQLEVVGLC